MIEIDKDEFTNLLTSNPGVSLENQFTNSADDEIAEKEKQDLALDIQNKINFVSYNTFLHFPPGQAEQNQSRNNDSIYIEES